MAAHQYWRITGVMVTGVTLELSDAMLLLGTSIPSPAPTISATLAPTSGTLSTLLSGTTTDVVSWDASVVRHPSFALVFDAGSGGVENPGLRLGSADSTTTFPKDLLFQYSDDGLVWSTYQTYVELSYPGNRTLTSFVPVPVGDISYSNVQLLLKGEGVDGSLTFIDNSPAPKTFTAVGDVKIRNDQSVFGGSSIYFDGSGDYLAFTASQLTGLGDFTVECWIRLASVSIDCEILCIGAVTTGAISNLLFETNAGGLLRGLLRDNSGVTNVDITTPAILTANTWTHVAFTVSGTTARVFVDGIIKVSGTITGTRQQSFTDCRIGYLHGSAPRPFNGHIDEFRVTKGLARYTADFVVPSAPFPITDALLADPDYPSVGLLLKGEGTDGSTVFTDSSLTPKTLARTGNTAISTSQSKFGAGSIAFDGAGDYLSFTQSNLLGTGDLTIEAWIRLASTSVDCEIFCIGDKNGLIAYDCVFECSAGGALRGSLQNGAASSQIDITTSAGVLTTGVWYHVAFSVSGSTGRLFVNGVQGASGTVSGTRVQGRSDCRVGYLSDIGVYDRSFNGYVDELRITKGVGRYTADFTPPAQTFPVISELPSDNLLATTTLAPRPSTLAHTYDHLAGSDLEDTVANTLKSACITGADIENGGTGRIYGTTKEKPNPSLPATPFSRRVLLVDERSQLIIRETWSDAATGAFEFRDLALGRPYTTLSYDHLRNYRAAIADNQLAEPQS